MRNKTILPVLFTFCLLIISKGVFSQVGLEKIIVEKYYISNAADSVGSIGVLPVGSVTYRIYVDMKPGYTFESAYGNIPHPLTISTTTAFFNNEDRGSTTPDGISVFNTRKNSVMIDSWLSVGATATGQMGVLKTDDTTGSIGNVIGILQNTDPSAGIPIKTEDGMVPGSPCTVTFVGFTNELDVFNVTSNYGNLFTTSNAAWACLNGATGPNPDTNRVIIAQITTNGQLSFHLNIQLGTPSGGTEQYVWSNPTGSETQNNGLNYTSPSNVGMAENKQLVEAVQIYPNPAKDFVTLKFNSTDPAADFSYSVYDFLGNQLIQRKLGGVAENHSEKVDLSSLANGIYLITVRTADGFSSSRKIIKNQ